MISSPGLVWLVTRILLIGEDLNQNFKRFSKMSEFGRQGEQTSTTQTFRRGVSCGKPPAAGGCGGLAAKPPDVRRFFLEKIAILMPFGSHFARFWSKLKELNF